MSSTRIHTIKKIDNYRIFQNWKPSGGVEFARVNLIYGQNGSGKSTLASLMEGCAAYATAGPEVRDDGYDEARSGLKLIVIEDDRSSTFDVGWDAPEFWKRIRIFNKDFVQKNLAFEAKSGPSPQALLTIGKISVDTEKQLADLRPKLVDVQVRIDSEGKKVERDKKTLQARMSAIAKAVVDDLRTSPDSRYRATNSYTKKQVRNLLDKNETVFNDASIDLDADRKTAISDAMAPVSLSERPILLGQDGVDEARRLIAMDVVVQVIDELREPPERAAWVQQGIPLHEDLDRCLFCGQALTEDRRDRLSAHFDDSLKGLQEKIDDLVRRLDDSVAASKTYLDAMPVDASVYADLRSDLRQARAEYLADHAIYAQAAAKIVATLKKKKGNPFNDIVLDSDVTLTKPSTAKLLRVVEEHSKRIDKHDEEARRAARRVELHHVKAFADEYQQLKTTVDDREQTVEELKKRAGELRDQIASLESVDGDPVPGAEELTAYVARLLGRDELRFSTALDRKHYVIERNGASASNLSEGEQTAIALLYFLVSVRKDRVEGDPPIVIIDDPVSSLDSAILFGASSYIWSELVVTTYVSQVFLMTHNFELFRQWLVQMESVPKSVRKKEGDYAAYEMRATCEADNHGAVVRRSRLIPWPLDDKKAQRLRSQYHFLFSRVADGLLTADNGLGLAAQMDVMALMPNAARRMLESFLSFHRPDKMGSFHGSMRAVLDNHPGLDDSVRTHVERYLHAHSHLEEADISRPLDPGELTVVLRSLFLFMDHVDHEHVAHMCVALDIDERKLLGIPVSATAEGGTS